MAGRGGETPAPPANVEVIVGGQALAVDGFNVDRGGNQLVVYTSAFGPATTTNEWGAEIKVERGVVAEILDQQQATAGDHNLSLEDGGYVISGHGTARTFLLDNAVVGDRAGFTEINIPDAPPPDTGGGGGCDTSAVDAAYIDAKAALSELTAKMTALEGAIGDLG